MDRLKPGSLGRVLLAELAWRANLHVPPAPFDDLNQLLLRGGIGVKDTPLAAEDRAFGEAASGAASAVGLP
jgi:hypothetical protein